MFKKLACALVLAATTLSAHAELSQITKLREMLQQSKNQNSFAGFNGTCITGLLIGKGGPTLTGVPECINSYIDTAFINNYAAQTGLRFISRTRNVDIGILENALGSGSSTYIMVHYDSFGRGSEVTVFNDVLQ